MNFDTIKKQMNASVENIPNNEFKIDLRKGKNNPVQIIRKKMIIEIIYSIIAMLLFLLAPRFVHYKMLPLTESTYLIFMSLTTIMIALYLLKLIGFLKKTASFELNTKDAIKDYIYEIKLTLESYKSYIIASSLLIPVPVLALISNLYGWGENSPFAFKKWFTLQINSTELICLIIGYVLFGLFIYVFTKLWIKSLYGKHVIQLESIIADLGEEEE